MQSKLMISGICVHFTPESERLKEIFYSDAG